MLLPKIMQSSCIQWTDSPVSQKTTEISLLLHPRSKFRNLEGCVFALILKQMQQFHGPLTDGKWYFQSWTKEKEKEGEFSKISS